MPDRHDEVDDEFRALMEGLRTTLPSVQVLFGFLLVLPFQSSFVEISSVAEVAYAVSFYGSALALVLLVAPSVHQRVRAPISGVARRDEEHVLFAAKLAIAGSVCFLLALVAGVFLVSIVVFEGLVTGVAVAVVAALALWSWFFVPLLRFGLKRTGSG
ncbi:MAG: hypothetical protein KatS3mg011_1456 [Acidimicrobiia bacterium]|nr:MAG: hypothetical protein KatS3mg011_1456 [Acidimicrobiia bacterium]